MPAIKQLIKLVNAYKSTLLHIKVHIASQHLCAFFKPQLPQTDCTFSGRRFVGVIFYPNKIVQHPRTSYADVTTWVSEERKYMLHERGLRDEKRAVGRTTVGEVHKNVNRG
jgi:hypothetical protein